jgi:hypothetical protein
MSDVASLGSPPWFAPLIGLRRQKRWVGLIGLEIQPGVPSANQKPLWKMVVWRTTQPSNVPTIKELFDNRYGSRTDEARYVGQWLPGSGTSTTGAMDYRAAYQAAQVSEIDDFDQAVVLRWSEGQPAYRHEWIESSLIFTHDGRANLVDGLHVTIAGNVYLPIGLPLKTRDPMSEVSATLWLTAYPRPQPDGGSFQFAELKWQCANLTISGTSNWNGYHSTGEFSGLARFGFNGALSLPARAQTLGNPGIRVADGDLPWQQHPKENAATYTVLASRHVRSVPTVAGQASEPVLRSWTMLDTVRSTSGALSEARWELASFDSWFNPSPSDNSSQSDGLVFLVHSEINPGNTKALLGEQTGDLAHAVHDGGAGDPVSFWPSVDSIDNRSGSDYHFICTVSRLKTGDPVTDWQLGTDSGTWDVRARFPRFGSYDANTGIYTPLKLLWKASPLPRFCGTHGLDLEWYISRSTLLNASGFRRAEGSLSLTFAAEQSAAALAGAKQNVAPAASPIDTVENRGTVRTGVRRLWDSTTEVNPYLRIGALQLKVSSATPYTRDLRPADLLSTIDQQEAGDFEEEPILIPLGANTGSLPYVLEVNEACEPPKVRNLRMELLRSPLDQSSAFGPEGFLVLDRTPFLFARVELPALARNDGFGSGVVFQRIIDPDSGQPEWQVALDLTATDSAVRVTLPPQATGEEMLLTKKEAPGKLYAYRFGAAARLSLAATYQAQRFATIPWNLRQFFGYPGQRDPGAAVVGLEFELLYGLAGTFSAKKADQTVRVAELFARLGSLPGGLPASLPWRPSPDQEAAWLRLAARWRSVARRYMGRLGILQPYSEGTIADLPLTKGLEFEPRVQSPGLSAPGTEAVPIGAQLYFPPFTNLRDDLQALLCKDATKGLAGGFLWGMQEWEAPFVELFWDNRRSSSAEVRDLAFSSLGGWGQQVARFASDRLLLQARVAMGRTEVYTVERIGKIAVFGHKAKHVIRYERSCVQSPHALDFDPPQSAEPGRPIVRKMEEYIELIEDRKTYPDHPDGQPLDTGMVQACFFPRKGTRIPIRHTWGRSIDRVIGTQTVAGVDWEVPLWRPNADPLLYPKPEIFIEMSSGTGSDARPVAQTIANPEDVYFYTTAMPGLTDDVNQWPPQEGIDYINAEEPTEWKDGDTGRDGKIVSLPAQENVPDSGWPGAVSTPPGFERFTFHLDLSQDEINLVANRRQDVMLHGRVRNVTMMRSAPGSTPIPQIAKPDADPAKLKAQRAAIANVACLRKWQRGVHLGLAETRALLLNKTDALKDPAFALQSLESTLNKAKNRMPGLEGQGTPSPASRHCPGSKNPILDRLISTGIDQISKMLTDRGQECVLNAFRPILDQLHSISVGQSQLVASNYISDLRKRIKEADHTVDSVVFYVQLGPEILLDALDQQLEHAFAGPVDRAHQLLDACTDQLNQWATAAENFVGDLGSLTGDSVIPPPPPPPTPLRDGVLKELEGRIEGIRQQADSLLADLQSKLAQTLQPPWNTLGTITDPILHYCRDSLNGFAGTLANPGHHVEATGLQKVVGDIRPALAGQGPSAAAIAQALQGAAAKATGLAQEPLKVLSDQLLLLRQQIRVTVDAQIQGYQDELSGFLKSLKTPLHNLDAAVQGLNGTLPSLVTQVQSLVNAQLHRICHRNFEASSGNIAFDPPPDDSALQKLVTTVATELWNLLCPLAALDFQLPDVLTNGLGAIDDLGAIKSSWQTLTGLVKTGQFHQALDELEALEHRLGVETTWLGSQIMPVANTLLQGKDVATYVAQVGGNALRTVRAVCNDLRTDGLGLNRKTVAMVLNFRAPDLNLTPVLGRLNQFGKQLGSLGLRLPVTQLTDRFLPDKSWLPSFDFSRIISDCGGARLEGLLKNLPAMSSLGESRSGRLVGRQMFFAPLFTATVHGRWATPMDSIWQATKEFCSPIRTPRLIRPRRLSPLTFRIPTMTWKTGLVC